MELKHSLVAVLFAASIALFVTVEGHGGGDDHQCDGDKDKSRAPSKPKPKWDDCNDDKDKPPDDRKCCDHTPPKIKGTSILPDMSSVSDWFC